MHKIIPLLTVTVLSSISGSPSINYIKKPFDGSFIPIFSLIDEDSLELSGLVELSLEKSLVPYFPESSRPFVPSSSSSIVSENDYFSCSRYGPFSLENPQDVNATFEYKLYSINSQTIIERIRLFKNGTVVSAASQPSFYYTQGADKNVTFTIPISDYWTSSGLELRFEILNSSRTILKAYSSSFYPPKNGQIPASTLKREPYTSNSLGFYGNGVEMSEFKETFDFRTIGDYIDNDYYYRLDITKNWFLYPNDYTFSYKKATLRFNDDEYLFSKYSHNNDGDIEIPLSLYRSGNRIHFAFARSFYVNKRTLDISDSYQPGWVYTSSFYLPINCRKKISGKTIYFDLQELGYDKISTVIPLKYELNRTIVGVCTDGDYCVIGGNS